LFTNTDFNYYVGMTAAFAQQAARTVHNIREADINTLALQVLFVEKKLEKTFESLFQLIDEYMMTPLLSTVELVFLYIFNRPLYEIISLENEIDLLHRDQPYLDEKLEWLRKKLTDLQSQDDLPTNIKQRCDAAMDILKQLSEMLDPYITTMDEDGMIKMKGDGNCLFHSIHALLRLKEDYLREHDLLKDTNDEIPTHAQLRAIAVKIMRERSNEEFIGYLIDVNRNTKDRESYFKKVEQLHFWASPAELYVLSDHYKIPFLLKRENESPWRIGDSDEIPDRLVICHVNDNHFDIQIPKV